MTQKGDISPDELDTKMQERLANASANAAKIVKSKDPVGHAQREAHEESKQVSRVDQARATLKGVENSARGVGQVKFWCILHTIDGQAYLHEGHWKINEVPSAGDMLKDKAVLGEYNPATIKRIQIFKSIKEAEAAAKEISDEREKTERRQAETQAKLMVTMLTAMQKTSK